MYLVSFGMIIVLRLVIVKYINESYDRTRIQFIRML